MSKRPKMIQQVMIVLTLAMLACNVSRSSTQSGAISAQSLEVTATPPSIPTNPSLTATPTPTATPTLTPTVTPTETATPTLTLTYTPTFTATPTITLSFTPTFTATVDPNFVPPSTATPTPTITMTATTSEPITSGENRFQNPGFEGSTRPIIFGEVNVYNGWEPFYCDEPYTDEKCPAERRGDGNPENLLMGRPEYKPNEVANRVHSGKSAQQWFCFFRVCRAGVYQRIETRAGERCDVTAWVQSWSASGTTGTDGRPFTSDIATKDDRDNSTWQIKVDLRGRSDAFRDGLLMSQTFGYADGHYDKFAKISFTFAATGDQATIYFENLRLWPFAHNDSYIDDAEVRCAGG